MEISDIHPIAVLAGIIGAVVGFIMVQRISGSDYNIGLLWKILTPIACGAGGFFIVQKMAD